MKFTKGAAREAKLWTRNGKRCNNKVIWDDGSYKRLRRRNFKLLHQFRVKRTWATKRKYQRSCRGLARCRNRLIKEWLEKKQREVTNAKNLTECWKAMDWYRRKKAQVDNISKNDWREYFMNLLEGEALVEEEDIERVGRRRIMTIRGKQMKEKAGMRQRKQQWILIAR